MTSPEPWAPYFPFRSTRALLVVGRWPFTSRVPRCLLWATLLGPTGTRSRDSEGFGRFKLVVVFNSFVDLYILHGLPVKKYGDGAGGLANALGVETELIRRSSKLDRPIFELNLSSSLPLLTFSREQPVPAIEES